MKKEGLYKTNEGILWNSMRTRTKENYFQSHLYFHKGITVCEEWKYTREAFCEWAKKNGYKKGLQLDRIDNSKGYSPNNCRFVTSKINNNNRDNTFFVTYNNETISLKLLVLKLNREENYNTIFRRIKRGWSHKDAIETPTRTGNYKRN